MALFIECTRLCAQKILDTADIVRDGDFASIESYGAGRPRLWNSRAAAALPRLFHVNRHTHPRMDAALKVMLAF